MYEVAEEGRSQDLRIISQKIDKRHQRLNRRLSRKRQVFNHDIVESHVPSFPFSTTAFAAAADRASASSPSKQAATMRSHSRVRARTASSTMRSSSMRAGIRAMATSLSSDVILSSRDGLSAVLRLKTHNAQASFTGRQARRKGDDASLGRM